jgi:hypothetical protein
MGYCLFSYGITADKIKAIFGSKDRTVLEHIKASDTFENYNENDFPGISVGTALTDIVNGDSFIQEAGYQYGYAIICICATLGSELPYTQEIKLGYETDFINKYLSESFNVQNLAIEEELLADNTNPFQIPVIEDWPIIGFVNLAGLLQLKEKFSNINITSDEIDELENGENEDDEEKGFAYQHIQGIIENIDYCIQNNLDLITFCH